MDNYVTKDTDQVFHATKIYGNVFFNQLRLDGLFDSVNVTDLDMNSVKILGDQYTNAEFIFENPDLIVEATQLDITETINGIPVKDFININDDFELVGDVVVDSLYVNECNVDGEINSKVPNREINGWHIDELMNLYLSEKHFQAVKDPITIETAIIRGPLDATFVNGFNLKETRDILRKLKTNEEILNESKIIVDNAIVTGNIYFDEINGTNFNEFKTNAIRLDETNVVNAPLKFLDQLIINGKMTVDHLNNINFDDFVNDLVRVTDQNVVVSGKTIFKEDIYVVNDVAATTVNDIPVETILTKHYNKTIYNPVHVTGDVTVSKLNVHGQLNGIDQSKINAFGFDENGRNYVIHANVFFNHTTYVQDLYLLGGYNNVGHVKQYLKDVVRIDRPVSISGTKTFSNRIQFENNIRILDYNGIDVQNFLSNVVLIDQYEPVNIYSSFVFEDPVSMPYLQVDGDLIVSSVNNYSLKDWYNYGIRTDQPFTYDGVVRFAEGTFQAANLNAKFLNGRSLDQLVTLYTPQKFSNEVRLDDVASVVPITTSGLVSGLNLPHERQNTLMVRLKKNFLFLILNQRMI